MVSLFFLRDIVSVIHLCHYMYETRSWHTYSYALGFAFLKPSVTQAGGPHAIQIDVGDKCMFS